MVYNSGMTTPQPSDGTAPAEQPKIKKKQKLEPESGSRLSLLFTRLPELEAAKKDAEEALAAHKRAIQAEVAKTVVNPDDMPDVFHIPADPNGAYPAYNLSAREGAWRLNTDAMKAQDPETYVKWAVKGAPYWELSRVRRNRVKR